MGFTAGRATERMIALRDEKKLPNFIGLDTLLAQTPNDRQKWLKDRSIKLSDQTGQGREGGERRFWPHRSLRLTGRRSRLAQGHADRARRALSAADRRAPPVWLALYSALADRADRAPCAGAGLRAARREGVAGGGAVAEGARSRLRLGRLSGRGLPPARRAAGAGLDIYGAEKPKLPPDEDEALHARRLVAQKCLYGVDRNPMAVDLARLSLWLATLARDHEFTFLDHALKAATALWG